MATMLSAGLTAGQAAPIADHHQHLFSPAIAALLATGNGGLQVITAREVVALLDADFRLRRTNSRRSPATWRRTSGEKLC